MEDAVKSAVRGDIQSQDTKESSDDKGNRSNGIIQSNDQNSSQSNLEALSNDQSIKSRGYLKHLIYPKNARHLSTKIKQMKSARLVT